MSTVATLPGNFDRLPLLQQVRIYRERIVPRMPPGSRLAALLLEVEIELKLHAHVAAGVR